MKGYTTYLSVLFSIVLVGLCYGFSWVKVAGGVSDKLTSVKKEQYYRDATRLALRLLSKEKDFQQIEAEVPYELVKSIYNALIAVHTSTLEASELVTKVHKLHTFPSPAVDNFLVIYERNVAWANPLRLGDCSTDNEAINALCQKYDLAISNNVEWDEEHNSFNVRANKALNIAPIARAFAQIEGIQKIDMLTPTGDGNDIEIEKRTDGWLVNYVIKFEACFKKCLKQHRWVFEVRNDGVVTFVEQKGDPLPAWMASSF